MHHPDELFDLISERQNRYRHEAYRVRPAHRPVRRVIGQSLIRLGTAISGTRTGRTIA